MSKEPFNLIVKLLAVGMIMLTAFTFIGFISSVHWVAGLLQHPRPQYLLTLVIGLGLLRLFRQVRWDWLFLIPIALNFWQIAPSLYSAAPSPQPVTALTITHFNMNAYAENHDETLAFLNGGSAEILSLQEVTPWALPTIEAALTNYRLLAANPLKNTHGSALFQHKDSMVTIKETDVVFLPETSTRPLLTASISAENQTISFLSLHVTRPRNAGTTAGQSAELQAVAAWSEQQQATGHEVVIMGDFNSTPWSAEFGDFLTDGNLINGQVGVGYGGSWPSLLPAPLRLPIDHAVHNEALVATNRELHKISSSDHLVLTVALGETTLP